MPGSGKTEAVKHLVKLGGQRVYFGQPTFDELKRRNWEVNEKNERIVREKFRKKLGMAAYAILCLPKVEDALKKGWVIAESLYSWEEYKVLKEKYGDNFKTLAIYAPLDKRIKRLRSRKVRPFTEEEVLSRDYAEIEKLNVAGPIAEADFTIVNDGMLEDLHKNTEKIFKKIIKNG